jgi:type IX secretion system PorP/SprF family membrane protein
MKPIISLIFLMISFCTFGQDLPVFRQYLMNYYFLNPAYAGSEDCSSYTLTNRTQWVGINGAPQTNVFSATSQFAKDHGIGLALWDDKNGPNSYKGLRMSYAYHLTLHKNSDKTLIRMAFSLAYVGSIYALDESGFTYVNGDPIIKGTVDKSYHHDALAGIYLYGPSYFGGVSVANLFMTKASFYGPAEPMQPRYYYVSGGFRVVMAKDYDMEPSILFKTADFKNKQIDFNTKFYYQFLNVAVSYRKTFYAPGSVHNSILGYVGVKAFRKKNLNLHIMYAYDLSLSDFQHTNRGSHEIMLQFSVCNNNGKMRAVNCPAFSGMFR